MIQKFAPIVIIIIQIISCIWYIFPGVSNSHVPAGFIRMIILGGIALFLLLLTAILYFIYKPVGLLWKIPFIISLGMIILAWFFPK